MRRTPRVRAVTLAIGVLLATPGLAVAEPASPDTLGELVAAVANTNQKLQDLGAAIQAQQESVNKAIVDVQTARDNAAATYVNGPSNSYLTAADPADILSTAAAGQTLAASSQQVITNLQRARTEQVNKESAARLAKQNADK